MLQIHVGMIALMREGRVAIHRSELDSIELGFSPIRVLFSSLARGLAPETAAQTLTHGAVPLAAGQVRPQVLRAQNLGADSTRHFKA